MPIVEPEVLCDGDHDLRTAQKVTERVGILLTIRALTHSVLAVDFVSVFFRRFFCGHFFSILKLVYALLLLYVTYCTI